VRFHANGEIGMTSTMAVAIFLIVASAGLLVWLEMHSRRRSREREDALRQHSMDAGTLNLASHGGMSAAAARKGHSVPIKVQILRAIFEESFEREMTSEEEKLLIWAEQVASSFESDDDPEAV